MKKTCLCIVLGTRPEAIKLAPLILAARQRSEFEVRVCNTGQHREMASQVLELFNIHPNVDLDCMREGQTLEEVTVSVISRLHPVLQTWRPDWLVVQGDTTTAFAAALAAFYQRIPVAHVEAGLRTGDIYAPWPEEMNRCLLSKLARLHFPPTQAAAANLLREGISADCMEVTGNTGIDALKYLTRRLQEDTDLRKRAAIELAQAGAPAEGRPLVLITGHRRESFGSGFEAICLAIATLAERYPNYDFVYPLHLNPRVRETVLTRLGKRNYPNVYLLPPLAYLPFVVLMARACLILTDSGGIQEEAPSLGKRVVVLREVTEREEGLATGMIRLAGTVPERIVDAVDDAISGVWAEPPTPQDIYGDGQAAARILARLLRRDPR